MFTLLASFTCRTLDRWPRSPILEPNKVVFINTQSKTHNQSRVSTFVREILFSGDKLCIIGLAKVLTSPYFFLCKRLLTLKPYRPELKQDDLVNRAQTFWQKWFQHTDGWGLWSMIAKWKRRADVIETKFMCLIKISFFFLSYFWFQLKALRQGSNAQRHAK